MAYPLSKILSFHRNIMGKQIFASRWTNAFGEASSFSKWEKYIVVLIAHLCVTFSVGNKRNGFPEYEM